jgi:hypothetical protein
MAENDLLWIEDAAREYNRSREWLQRQIKAGKLTAIEIPGDRRLYLSRRELDELLKPRPRAN